MKSTLYKALLAFVVSFSLLAVNTDASAGYWRNGVYYHTSCHCHYKGYKCFWIRGHHNRAGHWVKGHRVCHRCK